MLNDCYNTKKTLGLIILTYKLTDTYSFTHFLILLHNDDLPCCMYRAIYNKLRNGFTLRQCKQLSRCVRQINRCFYDNSSTGHRRPGVCVWGSNNYPFPSYFPLPSLVPLPSPAAFHFLPCSLPSPPWGQSSQCRGPGVACRKK